MYTLKRQHGFTLIEVIIAFIVITVLAVIAIPNYSSFIKQRKLVGLAEEVYHDMLYARSESISSRKNITVSLKAGSNWCYGASAKTICSCDQPNQCGLFQVGHSEYPGIFMATTGVPTGSLVFNKFRGSLANPTSIDFKLDNALIRITINKQGYPSLCKTGNIGDYKECE